MKIFVDSNNCIEAVGSTNDPTLKELYIIDDERNPFKDMPKLQICCYKVTVDSSHHVTMFTPYVPSSEIPQTAKTGKAIEALEPFVATDSLNAGDTETQFLDVPKGVVTVEVDDPEEQGIAYHTTRDNDIVNVFFDHPLKYAVDITIKVS